MKTFIALITFFSPLILHAQGKDTCSCSGDFEYIVNKITNDYVGYADKTATPEAKERLARLTDSLRPIAASTPLSGCYRVMRSWLGFFKDKHLNVYPHYTPPKLDDHTSYGKNISIDCSRLEKEWQKHLAQLDNIEGIWGSPWGDTIAIVKQKDSFIGIAASDSREWKKGNVVFEFSKPVNGSHYTFKKHTRVKGRPSYTGEASIDKNIMELHGERYLYKLYPEPTLKHDELKEYRMRFPNGANTRCTFSFLSDSTAFIRISLFDNYGRKFVDSICTHFHDRITNTPNLIIDLRGNGGGTDLAFQSLLSLIYTHAYYAKGVEELASEGNIAQYENVLKSSRLTKENEEALRYQVEEMKKVKGSFYIRTPDRWVERDTTYASLKRVGIIINGSVASSGEQFLLRAKNSAKCLLFGAEPTAGVLDYSSAYPIELPSCYGELNFPSSRSRRLPEYPIDNIGIAPDVKIMLKPNYQLYDDVDSWVLFVQNYMENWWEL